MDDSLLKLDFSALRTLQAVHDLQSFTRAADTLGQTQSNVSYTINRLRQILGDPLFVRENGQTRPTPRCAAIVTDISGLMEDLESVLTARPFDPATVEARVTISCNHYERVTILPGLIRHLRAEAPHLRLRSIPANTFGGEQLKRGECDLVMGPLPVSGEGVFTRALVRDRYVLIMDPANPLAAREIDAGDLAAAKFLEISFAGQWEPLHAAALRGAGIRPDTVVEIAEHGEVGGYVRHTDLLALVPERIAALLDPALAVRRVPVETGFTISMAWSTRTHRAPLHQWLRAAVAEAAKRHGAAPPEPPPP